MKNFNLEYFDEPHVEFGHRQIAEDSRDGLTLFGPYESSRSGEVRIGVIGPSSGLDAYKTFASNVNKPIYTQSSGRPFFPGFHSVFGLKWTADATGTILLPDIEISRLLLVDNLHERTYQLVSLYLEAIKNYMLTEEKQVDLWYIVIPCKVWLLCRPKSFSRGSTFSKARVRTHSSGQISFFPDEDEQIDAYQKMYESDSDFHDQMKARILSERITTPVQIMIEENPAI